MPPKKSSGPQLALQRMPPKSKSKPTARAASSGALSSHPGLKVPDPLLAYRLGSSSPLRLPDHVNSPSAATVLRSEYTITSDAAGHAVFGESFSLNAAKLSWTVTAGVVGVVTGAPHPQKTAFEAEARYARMVGMRVQVLYIGAEQTAAGYLSFCEKTVVADIDSFSVDLLHTGCDYQALAHEGVLVYLDYLQTPRYEVPSGTNFMLSTFPVGLFVASGLPATTPVFRVRVERFMEYLPVEGSLAEGETAHEPHNPGALAVHGELSGPSTSIGRPQKMAEFYAEVKRTANAAYHLAQPLLPYAAAAARAYLARQAPQMLLLGA